MLLGRDQERHEIDQALAPARARASATLVLVGETGIGKTALLGYAAERAAGMRVLRARGIESEAQIPFGSLFELLRPALARLDQIPAPQAAALQGALALRRGTAQERFAVGAATLSVLAAYAERDPVLVLVDDAQWLDVSSAQALLFAFRRLLADPIAVFVAIREGEPSLLDGADLPGLRLGGLTSDEAAQLMPGLAPETAAVLHRATAGNPLALQERLRDLGGHQDGSTLGSKRQVTGVRGEFQQRQRVPGGGPVQQGGRLRGQPGHELGGLVAGQPADTEGRQVGAVEQRRLTLANGDEDRDGVGQQTAEREQQRLRTRPVEPVGVVDEHGHRSLLGVGREQAERGRADREPLLRGAAPESKRAFQRDRLRLRDPVEHDERRAEKLEQGCERNLCLGFDSARTQDPHSGGAFGGVIEQDGFADSRLADQRERRARPRTRRFERPLYPLALALTTDQHRPFARPRCHTQNRLRRLGAPRKRDLSSRS